MQRDRGVDVGDDGRVVADGARRNARSRRESPVREREEGRKPRGGDSTVRTDGDDGDGQGGRFWAVCHGPQGEAPYSAPQAKKILGPKRRFTAILSDF